MLILRPRRYCLGCARNLSKYRVQGGPVEVAQPVGLPPIRGKTRMDGARSVCIWLEVGTSRLLDRL
jgi:hypothetical protein